MRALVRQILVAYGINRVMEAEDGALGFEKLKQKKADIVIVDWMMDRLNGIDFTRMVRTADDSPDPFVPIIMLTGYTEMQHVLEARDAGVTEFMAKPVSSQSLYDRIASVIETPREFVRVGPYFGPDRRRKISDFTGENRRSSDTTAEQETATTDENDAALAGARDEVGQLLQQ